MRISDWSSDVCSSDLAPACCSANFAGDYGRCTHPNSDDDGAALSADAHPPARSGALCPHGDFFAKYRHLDCRVLARHPGKRELGLMAVRAYGGHLYGSRGVGATEGSRRLAAFWWHQLVRDRTWRARPEERRVGKACVSKFRSRWAPYH